MASKKAEALQLADGEIAVWKRRALKAESREHSARVVLEATIQRHEAILRSLVWHKDDRKTVEQAIRLMRAAGS